MLFKHKIISMDDTNINEEFKFSSLNFEFLFKQSIENVWEYIRDTQKMNNSKGKYTNFQITNGQTWEVGCQCIFTFSNKVTMCQTTIEVEDDRIHKKIVFDTITNGKIPFKQMYQLFKSSSNDQCLLTYDFFLKNSIKMGDRMKDEIKYEKNVLFKNIDAEITKRNRFCEQSISCLILQNKYFIWNLLKKFRRKFCKIVNEVADDVISEDKHLKLNSRVTFIYNHLNTNLNFLVNLLQEDESSKIWKLGLAMVKVIEIQEDNKITSNTEIIHEEEEFFTPGQDIIFELVELQKNKNIFIFKNTFDKRIKREDLISLEKKKKKMIERFKDYCEKKQPKPLEFKVNRKDKVDKECKEDNEDKEDKEEECLNQSKS